MTHNALLLASLPSGNGSLRALLLGLILGALLALSI